MLLALAVVLSFCAVPAFAEDETASSEVVAKIGDTGYTTLDAALEAVAGGETIAIQKDFSETMSSTVTGVEFTIDLCGHTVSATPKTSIGGKMCSILLKGESKMTITDSSAGKKGKFSFNSTENASAKGIIVSNASGDSAALVLDGVTLEVAENAPKAVSVIYMSYTSSLTVKNSTISSASQTSGNLSSRAVEEASLISMSVDIENSYVVSNGACIDLASNGTNPGTTSITNSKIESKSETGKAINDVTQVYKFDNAEIIGFIARNPAAGSVINGGKFSRAIPALYVSDDTYIAKGADGMYTYTEATDELKAKAEATIGKVYYDTLSGALDGVKGSGTVTVAKDLNLDSELTVSSAAVLELNGKKVVINKVSDNANGAVIVNASFTVQDLVGGGVIEVGENVSLPVIYNTRTLTLNSGTIKGTGNNYVIENAATVKITGGLIENNSNTKALINNSKSVTITGGKLMNGDGGIVAGTKTATIQGGTFSSSMAGSFNGNKYEEEQNDDGTYTVIKKQNVASVNGTNYSTLKKAVAAAGSGDTVTLLKDFEGAGIVINKDITIDFGGLTYTVTSGVGSPGSETNAFQLLAGNDISNPVNVTFKNGKITSSKAYTGIRSYANLTLENMTVELTTKNTVTHALSCNNGKTVLTGDTNIIASKNSENGSALNVSRYSGYPSVIVTLDDNMTGKIDGNILFDNSDEFYKGTDGFNLIIKNGTVTGAVVDGRTEGQKNEYPKIGAFSGGTYSSNVSDYVADGYESVSNGDGTYTVQEKREQVKLFENIVVLRGTTPWLFAAVDSLNYNNAGFKLTTGGTMVDFPASIVCDSVKSGETEIKASDVDGGKYLFGIKLTDTYKDAFSAVPYVDDYAGEATYFAAATGSSASTDETTAE